MRKLIIASAGLTAALDLGVLVWIGKWAWSPRRWQR